MEYIETTLGCLVKYADVLDEGIKKVIIESIERDDLLKVTWIFKKIITLIISKYKKSKTKNVQEDTFFEKLLNELYTSLRKVGFSIYEFKTCSHFSKDNFKKALIDSCKRNEMYMREIYSDINHLKSDDKNLADISNNGTVFLLKISLQKIPNSAENLFVNLTQFKDGVYYIKTNDIFSYFYFYRTEGGVWFWSPPLKDDPEDIWMKTPIIVITDGFWASKKIPDFVEQFIYWLDIFSPNIPEFYTEMLKPKKKEVKEIFQDGSSKKFEDVSSKLEDKIKNDENCIIF